VRIAIIAPPWLPIPPLAYGGTEQVIDGLARGLQAAGDEVLLLTTGDSTCPVPTAGPMAAATGTVDLSAATELNHVIAAYDVALDWGAQVVHDHTLCGPVYARHGDLPIVTTNHGEFDRELGPLYRAISDDVAVVAISRAQAAKATGIRVAAVIHHGVDVDAHPQGQGDGGYCLFLGRVCPDKGVDVAARVARAAGATLLIAAKMAEPAEREYFEQAVAPLLGDGIEYIGEVNGDEKVRLLRGATCLLNPIQWCEPFGMVMVEALACGTPVVATPMGSVPEIVEDGVTGYLRCSVADLADAVAAVDRLDRGACREAAVSRFSLSRMVDDHRRLYDSVARGGP
jgi:glycosyltransferase involved in cell wall biosynthesis